MQNVVVCEDNVVILSELKNESIDLIYSDVLYNTGKKFDDYDDNLGTPEEAISWYHFRLIEMKRILKNTGLIYIHCDYNLSHYLKIELDKVFGVTNFRNEIIWYYNSAPRKKKDFGSRHDTIFRYSKSDDYYFNENSSYIRQEYSKTAPRGYEKEKYYDERGKIIDDVWNIPIIAQNDKTERVNYSTQKPKELLRKIIDSSCPKNGIVADFFCGSGTSLVVAKELNRNYIGCDINQKAIDITNKRLNETTGDIFK